MRPKSMVLILIALFCGLIASVGISQVVERQNKDEAPKLKTVKIFVAASEIDISEALTAQNVKLIDWPADKVPEGAIKDLDTLIDRRPRMRLFTDDPITQKKLLAPNETAGGSDQIPKGYRVMSVKVSMSTAVSYLIKPGDRVDILVFVKRSGGASKTTTLMRNVTVFAVNSKVTREVDDEGQALHAKTISMLVKPDDVEKLAHAEETGRIRLSLRRPDEEVEETESQGFAYEDEEPKPTPPTGSGTEGLLNALAASMAAAPVQPSGPAFEMQVMSGNQIQNFTWDDVNGLPKELQKPAGPTGPTAPIPVTTQGPFGASPAPAPDRSNEVEVNNEPPLNESTLPDDSDSAPSNNESNLEESDL